tara:strand:- start:12054 stop:13937 length:1884 start_codon:yes stop_codon:yes gene_type:complete
MAYLNTPQSQKSISYTNKDYNSIKGKLIEFAKVYYPNTFNDFSEGSPGMMFMEMVAYVGDILSFYQDTQIQELFLTHAQEAENIYNLAYNLGYKPSTTTAASTKLEIFQLLPAKNIGGEYVPDFDYALTINPNSGFETRDGNNKFLTQTSVNFGSSGSNDLTNISVFQVNTNTNQPEYYLLKKSCNVTSGEVKNQSFELGPPEKFKTLSLYDKNIIEIIKISDSDGNIWHEVPYLAQDTMFEEIENIGANDPELHQYNASTPYLLNIKKVPKRFITRVKPNNLLEIQFGAGISDSPDEEIIPHPDNVGLNTESGRNKLDKSFDPSNFLYSKAYGEPPSNTTLTVEYTIGGGISTNVPSNSIITPQNISLSSKAGLNTSLSNYIKGSLTSNNPTPATGGGKGDSIEDIRQKSMASFSTQQRTVTKEDYIIRTLSMPSKFGQIAKAYIVPENNLISDSTTKQNTSGLDLYVLGYNSQKSITKLNKAVKQNLSTYLEQYRTLTDSITIKDAYHINFGFDFEIVSLKGFQGEEVILNCIQNLKKYFRIDRWQINQPIIISEVKKIINLVPGVQNLVKLKFKNKVGSSLGYSPYKYDIEGAIRNETIYPSLDPSIFELKYPNTDINGKITQY